MSAPSLLLDSNIVIWLDRKPGRLPAQTVQQIRSAQHVYVSAVTGWELSIKQSLGGLSLARPVSEFIRAERMIELPITIEHGEAVQSLPLHHRDPFDRLLLAQTKVERLVLVTGDKFLLRYGVPILLV
jgi:PIN domain nuclease of toxin-antitoxin system